MFNMPQTPKQKKYKDLKPFDLTLMQKFPFLEEDFDSINLYGILSEIKDYLYKYFSNLDVQDEIDNKLDEMLENGELEEIIGNYALKKLSYYRITTSMTEQEIIDIIHIERPKVIEFETGEYVFNEEIRFTSNTIFLFNKAFIKKGSKMWFSYYPDSTYTEYNGIHNVIFVGGKFNSSVVLMHAKNIKFIDCEFNEEIISHAFQIASCSNIKILNCKFYGTILSNTPSTQELIQIENCSHAGQPYAPEESVIYDGTPNEYIYIEGCSFNNLNNSTSNLYKCIGTHSINFEEDTPFSNHVYIRNNEFIGTIYSPIHLMGFNDVYIENNKFENKGSCEYNILISSYNSNIHILNNYFRLGKNGICVISHNNTFKLIENVEIKNNKINSLVGSDNTDAIHLSYCRFVKIENNRIESFSRSAFRLSGENDFRCNDVLIKDNYIVQSSNQDSAITLLANNGNNIRFIGNFINCSNNQGALKFNSNVANVTINNNTCTVIEKLLNNNFYPANMSRIFNSPILIKDCENNESLINENFEHNGVSFNVEHFDTLLLNIGSTLERQWIELKSVNKPYDKLRGEQTYKGTIVDRNNNIDIYTFVINSDGTFSYSSSLGLRYIYGLNHDYNR